MEVKAFDGDYKRGIRFLLEKSKEEGINIRKVQWVPHVSKMLSEHDLCYKFWYNVWEQKKLNRVPFCNTWFDVMFDYNKCLFSWSQTYEGHSFWSSKLGKVLGTHVSVFSSTSNGLNRWLRD